MNDRNTRTRLGWAAGLLVLLVMPSAWAGNAIDLRATASDATVVVSSITPNSNTAGFRVSDWSGMTGTFPNGTVTDDTRAYQVWEAHYTDQFPWIAWNLGATYNVSQLHAWNAEKFGSVGRGLKTFTIQISDGTGNGIPSTFTGGTAGWTDVSGDAIDWSNTNLYQGKGPGDAGFDFVLPVPVTAQYIRFNHILTYVDSPDGGWAAEMAEVVFYSTPVALPTKLVYMTVPGTGVTGMPFSVTVRSRDADNNLQNVNSDSVVTLSLASGSGTLSGGTTTGTISNGTSIVTITGVVYSAADAMTLTATPTTGMTGLTPASTNIVFSQMPTHLVYTAVPGTGAAGISFSVTVQAQDAGGSPAYVSSLTTITLSQASGAGSLSGTLTGDIANGSNSVTIATPVYSVAGTMTLTATATAGMTGLTPVTSGGIVFSPVPVAINLSFAGPGHLDIADTNHVKSSSVAEVDVQAFRVSDWSGMVGTFPTASGFPINSHSNMWVSATSGAGNWIAWDLGSTYIVAKIHVWNFNDIGNDWGIGALTFQTSTDGANWADPATMTWTDVQAMNFTSSRGSSNWTIHDQDYALTTPVTTRYIRFNNAARVDYAGSGWSGLSEIVFYGLPVKHAGTLINIL